jgi:hypothetical protein
MLRTILVREERGFRDKLRAVLTDLGRGRIWDGAGSGGVDDDQGLGSSLAFGVLGE